MAHDGADLRELPDRVPDLLVEDLPVRDDDDRIEERRAVLLDPDELVGEPRDGVRFAASGRVLDQVPAAGAPSGHVRQELAHHVELVVARPQLLPSLAAGLVVLALDDLGVVLDDVGQPAAGEGFLPQVVGLEPVGVRRVAAAAVPPPVEGQEPRFLALEVGAEPNLVVVHGEVGQAAPQLEELLAGVAVALVLLDRVFHRLLGEAVLQLEGGDRQAVDEQTQVQRQLRVVAAVLELARHAETVQRVEGLSLLVPRRRRAVEQVDLMRAVLDALAEHVDGPALGDFPLQAG